MVEKKINRSTHGTHKIPARNERRKQTENYQQEEEAGWGWSQQGQRTKSGEGTPASQWLRRWERNNRTAEGEECTLGGGRVHSTDAAGSAAVPVGTGLAARLRKFATLKNLHSL